MSGRCLFKLWYLRRNDFWWLAKEDKSGGHHATIDEKEIETYEMLWNEEMAKTVGLKTIPREVSSIFQHPSLPDPHSWHFGIKPCSYWPLQRHWKAAAKQPSVVRVGIEARINLVLRRWCCGFTPSGAGWTDARLCSRSRNAGYPFSVSLWTLIRGLQHDKHAFDPEVELGAELWELHGLCVSRKYGVQK